MRSSFLITTFALVACAVAAPTNLNERTPEPQIPSARQGSITIPAPGAPNLNQRAPEPQFNGNSQGGSNNPPSGPSNGNGQGPPPVASPPSAGQFIGNSQVPSQRARSLKQRSPKPQFNAPSGGQFNGNGNSQDLPPVASPPSGQFNGNSQGQPQGGGSSLDQRSPEPQRNRNGNNQGGIDPPPGTPADPGIPVPNGTSCTTTSTEGVLGCNTGDGGTFNIVNGKRVG